MTRRSIAAVTLAVAAVLLAGGAVVVSLSDDAGDRDAADAPGTLEAVWDYEAETGTTGNHHEPAVATVDGETVVAVPINGRDGTGQCRLEAVDADGQHRWRSDVPAEHCSIHAVGDATAGDVDGDGAPEFAVGTGEHAVRVVDAATGDQRARGDLDSFGFSAPLVVESGRNASGDLALVTADFAGGVHGIDAAGRRQFSRTLEGSVWAAPIATGEGGVAVAHGKLTKFGEIAVVDKDGGVERRIELPGAPITWTAAGDDAVVVATRAGEIVEVDLRTGERRWTAQFGKGAAVGAVTAERAYLTAPDGRVHALDREDGDAVWSAPVSGGHDHDGDDGHDHDHPAPAPTAADVDGDGAAEVVTVGRDGTISVRAAESGDLLARHSVGERVLVHPVAAELDGDAGAELLVLRGDGRIVALSYAGE